MPSRGMTKDRTCAGYGTRSRLDSQALRRLCGAMAVTVGLLFTFTAIQADGAAKASATLSTTVSIQTKQTEAVTPSTAIGLNTAVWDSHLLDPEVPGLLNKLRINLLRFPGGSMSDTYHWQTNSITPGQQGYANPSDTFDAFMRVANALKANVMVTVNYGSNVDGTGGGSPEEAAAWVKYANVTHHDRVVYWEIGNEIYGNGTYGNGWETDLHADKSPQAYGKNALQFINAMKSVNKSIKIGVVLTAPGNWPDGQIPDWNSTVLSVVGKRIDFVIVHWYAQNPGNESDAGLLGSTSEIGPMVDTLREQIASYCGPNAKHVQMMLTESNSVSYNPGKQSTSLVNAVFLADEYLTWFEHGVQTVAWWDLHNSLTAGTNNSNTLYGKTAYGDYGILSSGDASGGVSEPSVNTPFPTYYGLEMVSQLAVAGARLVHAVSDQPDIGVHASVLPDGRLAILLLNRNPTAASHVSLNVPGFQAARSATCSIYGKSSSEVISKTFKFGSGALTIEIQPYELMTVILAPKR